MTDFSESYVPMAQWGKDHWSTLAYVETIMVDCGGFQVGTDPRMKSNRRHFRIMQEGCPRPRRVKPIAAAGMVMRPEHATVLKDGSLVDNHDDWMCLQDMAQCGLFKAKIGEVVLSAEDIEPGVHLQLSELGQRLTAQLRQHKANEGQWSTFEPVLDTPKPKVPSPA